MHICSNVHFCVCMFIYTSVQLWYIHVPQLLYISCGRPKHYIYIIYKYIYHRTIFKNLSTFEPFFKSLSTFEPSPNFSAHSSLPHKYICIHTYIHVWQLHATYDEAMLTSTPVVRGRRCRSWTRPPAPPPRGGAVAHAIATLLAKWRVWTLSLIHI